MIKIFDNIISKKEQETIKETFYGRNFPWYYAPDISAANNQHQTRPGFSHIFYIEGEKNSEYVDLITKISDNVNKKIKKKLNQHTVRSFLQIPLNEKLLASHSRHKEDTPHNTPHIDIKIPHTVFLYYVNDCDGDTMIYNYKSKTSKDLPVYEDIKVKKQITPKQGRVVIFDGMTWHSSTQPATGPRCVVNFDMV